jgi:tape measure domain-containing protein
MADGGVDFAVRLVNQVTGPAKQVQRSMADVKKSVEQTRRALEAPAPRNRRGPDLFDRQAAAARRSQARDFSREQIKLARAREREQARIQTFHKGMAQQKLDKQGGLADLATGGLGVAVGAVAIAATAAAAAVGYLAYKFGDASVQAAAFGERSRLALTLLLDSAPKAATEFESMRREAQELGLGVQDTQLGFQKLLAAQFEVGKAKELIRMSADLQAVGASADQTKRAIIAISQIKNTGYLQGDELNQLREAGVSTELVYKELAKRLNKTVPEIIKMQEKRQLDSTNVIESVLAAVRKKTNSEKAGDAGRKFATTALTGQANVLSAAVENAFLDIGDAILPGLKRLMGVIQKAFTALSENPRLANLGQFLLQKFEVFTVWVEQNWPVIAVLLDQGVRLMADSIRFLFSLFDTATTQGKIFAGVMVALGIALVLVTLAGAVLTAGVWLLVGALGIAIYYIGKLAMFVYDQFKWLYDQFTGGSGGAASQPKVTTAADSGAVATAASALRGYDAAPPTVAAVEQAHNNSKNVEVHIGSVESGVDKDALAATIRSQVRRELENA